MRAEPTIADDDRPTRAELVELYDANGWVAYTRDPEALERGVAGSLRIVTARDRGRLVGLARVVGDGATIVYLQDVLVHPDAHRRGTGRALLEAVFAPYAAVRQHVLLTDDEPAQRAFYEALGFAEVRDVPPGSLRAFVRFA